MKILLILLLLFGINAYADRERCLLNLNKSSDAQNEIAMFIVYKLDDEIYNAVKQALKYTIKARVQCKGVVGAENINLGKKIIKLNAMMDKYNPNKIK